MSASKTENLNLLGFRWCARAQWRTTRDERCHASSPDPDSHPTWHSQDQCADLAALLAQGEENHELARRFGSVASSPPQLEPEALHASYTEDFDAGARDRWDDDAENCSICSALLGRRRLRPRHHCRICGRCVCASCSPNLALMPGSGRELQRACTPCMAVAYKAPALKSRISQLGARLLGLSSASSSARAVPIGSLDAMLVLCEDAIGPLEGMQTQLIASQAE
ncbi:unnamed protein product, partial [Symbiodinium sp. CCMP2456]